MRSFKTNKPNDYRGDFKRLYTVTNGVEYITLHKYLHLENESPKNKIELFLSVATPETTIIWATRVCERLIKDCVFGCDIPSVITWGKNWLSGEDISNETIERVGTSILSEDIDNEKITIPVKVLYTISLCNKFANPKSMKELSENAVTTHKLDISLSEKGFHIKDIMNNKEEIEYNNQLSDAIFALRCEEMYVTNTYRDVHKPSRINENYEKKYNEKLPKIDWTGVSIFVCICIIFYMMWNMILYN